MIKVATILGTRPEIIRLSRVLARLDICTKHSLIHTGQNYDPNLNQIFFSDLEINKPSFYLNCSKSSLGKTLGKMFEEVEKVLNHVQPDAVLILGDTNSALSSIIAKRMNIPIYHMEAGNRCFDLNVPEETNRKIVDHTADFNLVYTEHARRHLIAEGIPHRRIYKTGSPMAEVLNYYSSRHNSLNALHSLSLEPQQYVIASLHRQENVDDASRLSQLLDCLKSISDHFDLPVVLSTHPRTKKRLDSLSIEKHSRIILSPPFGFHDYISLQKNSFCVISDSGTIAEESSILGFPAVTPRLSIERPEALDNGSILMSTLNPTDMLNAVKSITLNYNHRNSIIPDDYRIDNTSERVVNLILSTAKVSNEWSGIRK